MRSKSTEYIQSGIDNRQEEVADNVQGEMVVFHDTFTS